MFYFTSIRPYCNYLRQSKRRNELMTKLISKMENLRMKRDSPIIVATMETNPSFDKGLPGPYLD